MQKISIGNDHAGPAYKAAIVQFLEAKGYEIINHGTNTTDSVDYPDYAHPVATDIEQHTAHLGILICGSGNGVCMAANKHQSIRAALCWNVEIAQLARQHNDANIICIPARFVDLDLCLQMIDAFINTPFEGGRHANRVNKIACS